ncbi:MULTISPECIES: hypothetical protein [Streptomyces]|uniref:Uncharacterized protein n=1 Tax=Streptomyces edwardsiae TaxID=3075527 RepID=A0ABU2PWJ8_9ACTN|nr:MULTISPECIES: hypothetical protein [unclassified Streptomyces]MDT0396546.1 hypothetical protein [Streptomyces sp. DSM 41636]MDT0401851.1 hypothetical protein [Streptomyces sp. DSM 41635]
MVVLALLIPPVMLGVLLMLGRYEDFLLPPVPPEADPAETGPAGLGR